MNQQELSEFCTNCELLGISPFDAMGVKKGDRFTVTGYDTKLIFQQAPPNYPHIGVFILIEGSTTISGYTYKFVDVTPEKPYESNPTGSN